MVDGVENVHDVIAWRGEVEILDAKWSLADGRTVELRLCGEAFERVHPFKKFQQRRGGRMGTRFRAVFAYIHTGESVLTLDVMLAAWKDSSTYGQSIRLWLDNEVETHPFSGCTRRQGDKPGDTFALILVELNDDDSAIDQTKRDQAEAGGTVVPEMGPDFIHGTADEGPVGDPEVGSRAPARSTRAPPKRRPLSSAVHLLVKSDIFVRWLRETKGTLVKEWTGDLAKQYVKQVIKVESLSDLDRDPEAVKRYQAEIYRPYERWRYQHP